MARTTRTVQRRPRVRNERQTTSHQPNNNGRSRSHKLAKTSEPLADLIPFWRNLDILTRYQKSVWDNLTPWVQNIHDLFGMAPQRLWQSILPWSFSAFQFTNDIQGDPELEYKILTRVAGYGSQLGTIMDFLQVLAKRIKPELTHGQTEPDLFKVLKFYDLLKNINQAKGRPQAAPGVLDSEPA